MKMHRCSLTGFFSSPNGQMVYDENKTVILNIDLPYEYSSMGELADYFMNKIFSPREPVGDIPLHTYRVGGVVFDESQTGVFTFYKKNDPLLTNLLNDGGAIIESNTPMSFKINKLTDEQKQADEFSSVPYLDVYDALIDFTDDRSTQFESLGYSLSKVDNQQIVFQSLTAVNMPALYPSGDVSLDEIPPISCDGAGTYIVFEPWESYDNNIDTSGMIKIVDTVKQTGKRYYFNNFTEFFESKWVRDTIAHNHQSLTIDNVSSGGYGIGLYGYYSTGDEEINATKITITLNNPDVKLMVRDNSAITGDMTNAISACLNLVNLMQN